MFPFPETPTPSPGSRRPPVGTSAEDRGKIILLCVGLLFCLALMTGLYAFTRSGKAPEPPSTPGPAPTPSSGPAIEITPVPLFPEEQAQEIEKDVLERMAGAGEVLDGVPAVEPGPFEFLVDRATLDVRVLNLMPEGFDRAPDTARILADPGSSRGKLLSVSGELLSLEKVPWEGKARQVLEVRRGLLRDGKGRLFTFSWPLANPLEPDPVEPGKGWVRVRGLFYKVWPVPDPAAPGKTAPTFHLVLQHAPERSYPDVVVKDIDPAWMEDVRDADTTEMLRTDDDPFYYLLNFLDHQGPEGFEGWLRQKQQDAPGAKIYPPEDFTGRYKELLANPLLYRFRPVRYTGFLLRPTVHEQDIPPNPGNVERLWMGYLVDVDFAPAVWVFSPRSLAGQGFKDEDRIRVDGIFYKRVAYQAQGKGPLKQAVVILAGNIVRAPTGKVFAKDLLMVVVGLMLVVAAGLAVVLFRGRGEDRRAEEHRLARIARRRKGPAVPGGAPAAGGDPPAAPPPDPAAGGGGTGP